RRQAAYACDLTFFCTYARDRSLGRLEYDRHMGCAGMHERPIPSRNRHMTVPEHKIASPQLTKLARLDCAAERPFLHVAVARTSDAAGAERELQQTRAVHAKTGLSAPQIRRPQKALRDRDEIGIHAGHLREMHNRNVTPGSSDCERLLDARDGKLTSEGEA